MTWKQASQYLPKQYFPIEDEAKLIRIAQLALAARAREIQRRAIVNSQKAGSTKHG
jgi:hypothetical protein